MIDADSDADVRVGLDFRETTWMADFIFSFVSVLFADMIPPHVLFFVFCIY